MAYARPLPPVTPEWMRVSEAAARLEVNATTVRKHLRTGVLPVRYLQFERVIRLNRQDFEQHLERASRLLSNSA